MTPVPTKKECAYIIEMLESRLINYSYTQPWAEEIIAGLDIAPWWLGDVATKTYQGDQIRAFNEYIYSEPIETLSTELEKFHVACLWLRYERRELSWHHCWKPLGKFWIWLTVIGSVRPPITF